MKRKFLLVLCTLLFSLSVFSSAALAVSQTDSVSNPNTTIVCRVHGSNHVAGRKSFEKYAYKKWGTLYNCTCNTCDCGAEIFTTDEGGYFYASDIKEWAWHATMNYMILKPNGHKFTSKRNPPYWNVGLNEY